MYDTLKGILSSHYFSNKKGDKFFLHQKCLGYYFTTVKLNSVNPCILPLLLLALPSREHLYVPTFEGKAGLNNFEVSVGVKRDRIYSCFNSCLFYKTFSDYDEIMLEMQEIQDVLPPFVCFKFVGIVIKIEP